ncbi:MAG TPA: hypothetical protein VKL40_12040 [Candidatus Angelobacter sp.]|nr:hypothetical protein [Candidatus Angelobacter sp.]
MNLQEQERGRAAEEWLDQAIGHLRSAGPRAGLEKRILAGLQAHAEQRRRRWTFAVAASAAAVLVSAVVASWPRSRPEATPSLVQKTTPVTPISSAPGLPAMNEVKRALKPSDSQVRKLREVETASVERRPILKPTIEAREATFPSPAPLNEQGRLLQAYLRQTPPQQLALVAARQPSLSSLESEDLSIAPLQIADLTPKAEATKDQDPK